MMGRSHFASGAVVGLALSAVAPMPDGLVPWVVGTAAVSSLVPDLDHPSGRAANALPPVTWVLCWAVRHVSVRMTGVAHRGGSHSAVFAAGWGVLFAAALAFWVPVLSTLWLGMAAAVGCLVGVLGDVLTVNGCAHVLWPSRRRVVWPEVLRFRTGGPAELVVFGALVVAGCLLLPAVA